MTRNRNDDDIATERRIREMMGGGLPEGARKRMERQFEAFGENLGNHPAFAARRERGRRVYPLRPVWRLAWTAGGTLTLAAALALMLWMGGAPTWAEVNRQFQSAPFLHAAVYIKNHPYEKAVPFELWRGEGGRVRLHYRKQVLVADAEGEIHAYDIEARAPAEPERFALEMAEMLQRAGSFSLETLIRTVFDGGMDELRPLPAGAAEVTADLSVFDLTRPGSPESVRIWTLRGSMLPIQLRMWNPETGESVDALFTYPDQRPAAFFDPAAFERALADPANGAMELLRDNLEAAGERIHSGGMD